MRLPDTNDGGPCADRKAVSPPCPTVAGSAAEIRVFFDLTTDNGEEWLAAASALLDGDEIARAKRLRFDADRRHFIAGRALVRRALSRFIDVDPADWRFVANSFGRPQVSAPAEGRRLRFSASRTAGLVMVAVTTAREIGADVERLGVYPSEVAPHFFSADEAEAIRRAPQADRSMLFFRLWTLKEAYAKARGIGLSIPLPGLSFRQFGETARLTIDPSLEDDSGNWTFRLFQPGPRYVAALCVDVGRRPPVTVEMERLPVCRETPPHSCGP